MSQIAAILGPTNTGKTHLAIERILEHKTAVMGLPLRLLAREVYDKLVRRVGPDKVELITGEEKITPPKAVYTIATTEAMPKNKSASLVVIDEIQLCTDFDRGHIFTDRLLNFRGTEETLILGAHTMAPLLKRIIPNITITSRQRFSDLIYTGYKKLTRLPKRTAIITFSAEDVYAIAELLKRQAGGAAIVLGALSPRTRNAQVALFENGDVDYIVATDAIGMGLNLNIDHIAFAASSKFDGTMFRPLTHAELGQIAGRAGRYMNNGTFGTTGDCPKFDPETIQALQTHTFQDIKILQWRNTALDMSTPENLLMSLTHTPQNDFLTLTRPKEDLRTLDTLIRRNIPDTNAGKEETARLWELCQLPDYRKISINAHIDLIETLLKQTQHHGVISAKWLDSEILRSEQSLKKKNPSVDAIMQSLSHMRTWAYISNQKHWHNNAEPFQTRTKELENALSDQLHEAITRQFVDMKTSVLLKKVEKNEALNLTLKDNHVYIDQTPLCVITGLNFTLMPQTGTREGKKLLNAAKYAAKQALKERMTQLIDAPEQAFTIGFDKTLRFNNEPVATLKPGGMLLAISLDIKADDSLDTGARNQTEKKLQSVLANWSDKNLAPLLKLNLASKQMQGTPAGLLFTVIEHGGILPRETIRDTLKTLTTEDKTRLRKLGLRFGHSHIYIHDALKPETRKAVLLLQALHNSISFDESKADALYKTALAGRTSFENGLTTEDKTLQIDPKTDKDLLSALGYTLIGSRLLRVDILDRFQEDIRKRVSFRLEEHNPAPPASTQETQTPPSAQSTQIPEGAALGSSFYISKSLCALLGCSVNDVEGVLKAMGYVNKMVAPDQIATHLNEQTRQELNYTSHIAPPKPDDAITCAEKTTQPIPALPEEIQIWFFPKKKQPSHTEKHNKSVKKDVKPVYVKKRSFDKNQHIGNNSKTYSTDKTGNNNSPSPFDALKDLMNNSKPS